MRDADEIREMPGEPLRPGDPEWIGPHRVLAFLGEGGEGTVYLARDGKGTRVAVKLLRAPLRAARDTVSLLHDEIEIGRRLPDHLVAKVLDAGTHDGLPYIVTEYVAGTTLEKEAAARPLTGVHLRSVALGILLGLTYIHENGVVHRDLKPSNVMLGHGFVCIIDFGIAHAAEAAHLPIVGSPPYMAPERYTGTSIQAGDIWAWAATVVYAATGRPPFGDDAIDSIRDRIHRRAPDLGPSDGPLQGVLRDVLGSALARDPQARPSARDALARLQGLGADVPNEVILRQSTKVLENLRGESHAAPPPAVERNRPASRGTTPRWAVLSVLGLVALIAAAIWVVGPDLTADTDGAKVPAELRGTWTGPLETTRRDRLAVRVVITEDGTDAKERFYSDAAGTEPSTPWNHLVVRPSDPNSATLEDEGGFHVRLIQVDGKVRFEWHSGPPGSGGGRPALSGTLQRP